jgi:DNA modification methylase
MNEILDIPFMRTCNCKPNHINCLTAKEWLKCQIGVWKFYYEKRDIRNKVTHPAVFPISLASKVISLFSHEGELILDPFVGSGTSLLAASDLNRNALGIDLNNDYISLCQERLKKLSKNTSSNTSSIQIAVNEDARNAHLLLGEETVSLIFTSPPYANLLNRKRQNKSRRGKSRKNSQYLKIEQYSQDSRDLGILEPLDFAEAISDIFSRLLPLLKPKGHCVINIPDIWMDNKRITLHILVTEALRAVGFELRNTIIWDRENIVNRIGIFGWPSNYITMGTTFEYLLDFWRP